MEVFNNQLNMVFFVTFVYASNNVGERQTLWEDLKIIALGRKVA